MQVTSGTQNSSDDTSQEIGKQTEGESGAESGETPPVAVPPVVPLPEDRAAALDELCRSLNVSDGDISTSAYRHRLETGLPWDTDPRLVADALGVPLRARARWDEQQIARELGTDPVREPACIVVDLGGSRAH